MKNIILLVMLVLIMSSTYVVFAQETKTIRVVINPTIEGSSVKGEVILNQENNGVMVTASLQGLTPGNHGFHFHENPSCEDAGKAAGSHFNPDNSEHGFLPEHGHEKAHAGDMGNITADATGNASLTIFMPKLNLIEGQYSLINRSIIVHEKEDDFGQPLGNAGGRIGCGIIK